MACCVPSRALRLRVGHQSYSGTALTNWLKFASGATLITAFIESFQKPGAGGLPRGAGITPRFRLR